MNNIPSIFPNISRAVQLSAVSQCDLAFGISKETVEMYPKWRDDYIIINGFYKKTLYKGSVSSYTAKMIVEMNAVDSDNAIKYILSCLSIDQIQTTDTLQKEVKAAKDFMAEVIFLQNDSSILALLKTAHIRFKLSLADLLTIKALSVATAALEKSRFTKPEHIAEAIHYVCLSDYICCEKQMEFLWLRTPKHSYAI